MNKRGPKAEAPKIPGRVDLPDGFHARLIDFLDWTEMRGLSALTAKKRRVDICKLIEWCEARALFRPNEVTKPILERYQRHLYHFRNEDGGALSFRSQNGQLSSIKVFFRWCAKQNYILYNPASDIELPKYHRPLPRYVLTAEQAEHVLSQPDIKTHAGLRDRAMLETLYSNGIRRAELLALQIFDLDTSRGTLLVRQGKGKKDRVVPIGERALLWIDKYMNEARPSLLFGEDDGTLFLSVSGAPISALWMSAVVRQYVDKSGLGKWGACHLFRHTMATLMLENGADIRFIQAMLGHAQLTTTELYTRVSIHKLKEIHSATHPSAKVQKQKPAAPASDDAADLLAALSAEADDEIAAQQDPIS